MPKPVEPSIKYPFLWRSEGGCVYLRNADHRDIILVPAVQDQKLGMVVDNVHANQAIAWAKRLMYYEVVELANTGEL